jgi:hypothetical protein
VVVVVAQERTPQLVVPAVHRSTAAVEAVEAVEAVTMPSTVPSRVVMEVLRVSTSLPVAVVARGARIQSQRLPQVQPAQQALASQVAVEVVATESTRVLSVVLLGHLVVTVEMVASMAAAAAAAARAMIRRTTTTTSEVTVAMALTVSPL